MRVLVLTRYARSGASSRVRAYQYQEALRQQGIELNFAPLFDDAYLQQLYRGAGRDAFNVARAYAARCWLLLKQSLRSQAFDAIWLEKECLPWVPLALERWLLGSRVPIVLDIDDAIFHNYDLHPSSAVRSLLAGKIDALMRRSACVTAGSAYLAERARRAGATRVELIPSVIDLQNYPEPSAPSAPNQAIFTIGWIGSPATEHYLLPLAPMLSSFCAEHKARLLLIGISAKFSGVIVGAEQRDWSEAREAADLAECDIGIMPLADDPWSRGKCGYKLIQYMACGKPVIASPVGANSEIVLHGETGLLAQTPQDWHQALQALRNNAGLARSMGRKGRKRVEQCYSVQALAPRLGEIFLGLRQ